MRPLKKLGYQFKGNGEVPGRLFFVKGSESKRTHHLSVVKINSKAWKDHILFRNYLLRHPKAAQEYGKLKLKLVKKFSLDRKSYTAGKNKFIQKILKKPNNFYMANKNIEICVRAMIQSKGRILVCWHKEKQYYFFPGGHLDFGEMAEAALIRELKEELDIVVKKLSFIGLVENIYIEKRDKHKEHQGKHHEINLVFDVKTERVKDKSLEDHIDFVFLDKKDFASKKIFPLALKKQVLKWLKDKKPFWASQI